MRSADAREKPGQRQRLELDQFRTSPGRERRSAGGASIKPGVDCR